MSRRRIRRKRKLENIETDTDTQAPNTRKKRKKNNEQQHTNTNNLPISNQNALQKLTIKQLKGKMTALNIKIKSKYRKNDLIEQIMEHNTNDSNDKGKCNTNNNEKKKTKQKKSPKGKVRFNFPALIFGGTEEEQNEIKKKPIPERKNQGENQYNIYSNNKKQKRLAKGKAVCISAGNEGVLFGWIDKTKGDKILIKWETEEFRTKQKWYHKNDKHIWLRR